MRKTYLIINIILLSLILLLAGCSSSEVSSSTEGNSAEEMISIGIVQIMEHPSLDNAREGFLKALADNGYKEGENLKVDYRNAQGDMPTLNTIANSLVSNKSDLILAIATPSAQAVANATKNTDIPVLFTAVTDPVEAGLVQSMEKPGMNLTGTTDMAPIADQIKLITEIKPDVKNIGVIYNTSEVNSLVQLEIAKEAATKLGLNIVEATATNTSEVSVAAKSLVGKVDAIYVPTDNVVVTALESVVKVAQENNLLLVSSEKDSVSRGAVATIGLDYYKLGQQTGEMAVKILKENSLPKDMPVETLDAKDIIINLKAATAAGIEIPQAVLDKAQEIIE